jgi:hypothetical protein
MEAAAVETTAITAAMETTTVETAAITATVIARTPVDSAIPAIPTAVITAAVVAAAIIGRAIIPAGIKRRTVAGGRVDAGLITTSKRERERRKDCAQKNPTANHGFLSLAYVITPELTFRHRATNRRAVERSADRHCCKAPSVATLNPCVWRRLNGDAMPRCNKPPALGLGLGEAHVAD